MKHLNIKQYITGYDFQIVYSSSVRDEKFKIELKLNDGGSLIYYGTDEDVIAIGKLIKDKKPVNIRINSIGEV